MAFFPQPFCAPQRITSSGVIGTSGNPTICYGYSVLSGGSGVGSPWFLNGGASGAIILTADPSNGAASKERTIPLPVGTMFGSGIYVSFDGNTSAVTVFYTDAH